MLGLGATGKCIFTFNKCCIYVTEHCIVNYSGPWFIGEVLTGVYGTVGVHGVSIKGHFIPGSMTYTHGIIQVSTHPIRLIHFYPN